MSQRALLFLPIAALGLVAYWALLFRVQRRLLFPAPPMAGAPARPPDAVQVWLPVPDGRVEAWLLPARSSATGAPLLIFLHGNAELIDDWPDAFELPRSWGMAVLLVEYPGYGRSSGQPSQASITAAVVAAYDWARARPDFDPTRIVAYGRSVGGGGACALAARREVAALVLESSFTSVRAFAPQFGAPGFLVRDPFDNQAVVARYRGPLLIIHGDHDEVIPTRHGRALAAAAPQAELHLLPCGHNDCPRPWPILEDFLRRDRILPDSGESR
jgi:fermentation-respiration switch protein FrsA (DUF1100 family)